MTFLKQHWQATAVVVIAALLTIFGWRMFSQSAQIIDLGIFMLLGTALMLMPIAGLAEQILRKLGEQTAAALPCERTRHQEPEPPMTQHTCGSNGCGRASDCSVEAEIQAKGKTAARVTPDDIQREIVGEHYFTAEQGARHPDAQNPLDFGDIPGNLGLLTFCVLRLRNGFTVTGESACASPENFDAAIGRRIARENAVQKVWPLLGFRLRDKLAAGA